MKTLVIDTATPACSVALFEARQMIAGDYAELGRGHAERLIPMIAALPGRGKADAIMVNIGPGSFTGIRVGISAAKALALAWDASCGGYTSLQMIAAMARANLPDNGSIDVAMQAGHGEFFFQGFDRGGIAVDQAQSLTPSEAAAISNAQLIAGSAAGDLASLRQGAEAVTILPDARAWPLIADTSPLDVRALYIRAADAKPAAFKP